jgi:hypothetical protein
VDVASEEVFARLCERVCRDEGWNLLPTGVQVFGADGRQQVVTLEFFEFEGSDLVRLSSTIGSTSALAPGRLGLALQVNARLAHGALAVSDGDLILTDTLILADADPGEVSATLRYLAETADYYEKIFFGTDEH